MANVVTLTRKSGKVSEHFKASEFACKDGTTNFLLDKDIIPILERFREYVEAPVTINSAYRTKSHNASQGGASNSYHLYGRAFDVAFSSGYKYLTSVDKMCNFFNTLGLKGIIKYPTFVHIDTRTGAKYHANNKKQLLTFGTVNIPFKGNLKQGSKNIYVGIMQYKLKMLGYNIGNADMIFGTNTLNTVKQYQKSQGLAVDGIVGKNTWTKLFSKGI